MRPTPSPEGFSFSKLQRYVLYIATIILLLSLFIDTRIIDSYFVQKGAFIFVMIGLVWWVIEEILDTIINYVDSLECKWDAEKKKFALIIITGFWFACLIVGLLVGLSMLFPKFLLIFK